jgi:hypothetical protein
MTVERCNSEIKGRGGPDQNCEPFREQSIKTCQLSSTGTIHDNQWFISKRVLPGEADGGYLILHSWDRLRALRAFLKQRRGRKITAQYAN